VQLFISIFKIKKLEKYIFKMLKTFLFKNT